MSEEEPYEKPEIEPREPASLCTMDFCSSVKEKIGQIKICMPSTLQTTECTGVPDGEDFACNAD
ncbi:MAG: hypothetical protein HXS44_16500 [Theionarchaea archaeon]|nr:hypothetical protein [Theionarchaea archaeon]